MKHIEIRLVEAWGGGSWQKWSLRENLFCRDECCAYVYESLLPSFPDAARPDSGIVPQPMVEENFPVAVEPGEMPDPEMIADVESQENASNCFPDPIDN